MTHEEMDRVAAGVAALMVLACCALCCVGASLGGTRDTELMRACAEACGDAGMASWDRGGGCECREAVTP